MFSCSCITVWLCVCYISIAHLFQHCHQCIYCFFVMLYSLTWSYTNEFRFFTMLSVKHSASESVFETFSNDYAFNVDSDCCDRSYKFIYEWKKEVSKYFSNSKIIVVCLKCQKLIKNKDIRQISNIKTADCVTIKCERNALMKDEKYKVTTSEKKEEMKMMIKMKILKQHYVQSISDMFYL